MNTKIIVAMLIGMIAIGAIGNVSAVYDADTPWSGSVKWTIPSDTSFTVTFSGATASIDFNATSHTETVLEPVGQTGATPVITITNTGNQPLDFNVSVPEGCPSWAELKVWNTSTYADSVIVNTSGHIVGTAIAAAGTQNVFMWTNISTGTPGVTSKTTYINSSI